MKNKGTNIFISMLYALGVKHSKAFSNKFYNEHPHKYNLLGISNMLTDYGIDNAGTRIKNKSDDIGEIETPFLAHVSGDFGIVYKVTDKSVTYRIQDLDLTVPRKNFCEAWTGVVLLAEANPESAEPDYRKNRRKDLLHFCLKFFLLLAISLLFAIIFMNNHSYSSIGISLSLVINIIGAYIGFLLVQKQLDIHSRYSDKICSLFKQADCNDILESNAAKLWGVFGWSEIGFSYFLSNIIILAFLPELINYYAILNICALPYTIWSIWYQKFKAKQWCMLCLLVQFILWCIFFINLLFQHIQIPVFDLPDMLLFGAIYFISFISITLLIPYLSEQSKVENITQEINSFKANEKILGILLKEQPYYQCDRSTSQIVFGNPDANILVTILTNPHCNPCAKMHSRIEKLIDTGITNLCIQYVFSSFEPSLDISNTYLTSVYLNSKNKDEISNIYNLWFTQGKLKKEDFFEKFPFDLYTDTVKAEFENHRKWKSETKLEATPTILVNGYKLPGNYQIEDLRFISELDLE